jgi:uncharacterized alkaline shock family protein YloU
MSDEADNLDNAEEIATKAIAVQVADRCRALFGIVASQRDAEFHRAMDTALREDGVCLRVEVELRKNRQCDIALVIDHGLGNKTVVAEMCFQTKPAGVPS